MTKNISILLILIMLAAALWFLATNDQTSVSEPVPSDTASSTVPVPDPTATSAPTVTEFMSDPFAGVSFSLELPASTTASQVRSNIYEFKFIGPKSEPQTEITDGYYISVSLHEEATLYNFEGLAEAIGVVSSTTIASYDARTYETENELSGQPVPHYVLQPAEEVLFDISYSVYGDRSQQYEQEVQQILNSLEVRATSTGQGTVPEEVREAIDVMSDRIQINTPSPGGVIQSPQLVRGEARGSWFFEADFPVVLTDWDGRIIAETYATAEGGWMTGDFVPFQTELTFTSPYTAGDPDFMQRGTLILQRANPSGLPENDAALEIPVLFSE